MFELFMGLFMALQLDRYIAERQQTQECSVNVVEISASKDDSVTPIAQNMNFDKETNTLIK